MSPARIDIKRTIGESFDFVSHAVMPTLVGTGFYALTSIATALIVSMELLGDYSAASAGCLYGFVALSWFAMALRRGTGRPEKGIFGMTFGVDEIRLGLSALAVIFALALVAFFIGFAVFLITMSTVIIDSGQLGNEEALTAYLQNFQIYDAGLAAQLVIFVVALIAVTGFLYLLVRVLPFAPGSIARKKIMALEAVVWTKYLGTSLLMAFVASAGIAISVVAGLQWLVSKAPIHDLAIAVLQHLLGCFAALTTVGYVSSSFAQLAPAINSATD